MSHNVNPTARPHTLFSRWPLRYKITLLLMLAALVGVFTLSYTFIETSRRATETLLKEYHIGVSDEIGQSIVSSLASNLSTLRHVVDIFNEPTETESEKVALARSIIQNSTEINFLAVYDEEGRLLDIQKESADDVSRLVPARLDSALMGENAETTIPKLWFSTDSLPYIQIVVPWDRPVDGGRKRVGYVSTVLPFIRFSTVVAQISYRRFSGRSNLIYLISDDGTIVAGSDISLVKRQINILSTDFFNEKGPNVIHALFNRDIGLSREYTNYAGVKMLASLASSSRLHLGILVEEPLTEAYASVRAMTLQLLFWSALSFLLSLLVGTYFSRSITRPLGTLAAATHEIAEGKYDVVVPISSSDEIAELSIAFNRMSGDLKRSFDELREAHDYIVGAEKMAVRGEIVAEVSHELKNILQILMIHSANIRRHIAANNSAKFVATMKMLDEELGRMRAFNENLMVRGSGQQKLHPVDLNETINSFCTFIKGLPKFKKSALNLSLGIGDCSVLAHPDHIRQILLNLANNAVEATPGCSLSFKTEYDEQFQTVTMEIGDNGAGIPPDIVDKLFTERVTTKEEGHGFGLRICQKLVESMNGSIRVDSKIGKGTNFAIMLPSANAGGESLAAGDDADDADLDPADLGDMEVA